LLKTISKFRPNVVILGVCEKEELWTAFGAWHSIFMNRVDSIDEFRSNVIDQQLLAKLWGAKKDDVVLLVDNDKINEIIIK
jgi:pyruvate kinase